MNKFILKIKSLFKKSIFFITNYLKIRSVKRINEVKVGDIIIRGCKKKDYKAVEEIYKKLNNKNIFPRAKRWLYFMVGQQCLIVAIKKDNSGSYSVVGINLYYINDRDIKENTIHEGFIGVLPEVGGQGISGKMRKEAIRHFKESGFYGISTRISLKNKASLSSAEKNGFKKVEEYFEASTGEKRCYMICLF